MLRKFVVLEDGVLVAASLRSFFGYSYYNKHKEEAWRMNLDYVNVEK